LKRGFPRKAVHYIKKEDELDLSLQDEKELVGFSRKRNPHSRWEFDQRDHFL
jgi:hypothetical protein